ncbi:hypothetical protein [Paenibacillus sp. FJAT-26967]|uniref:hypothetical protein n=1 Tax=Paenibacillus sp. FJAT-26967 TaxID=1729690 RepID=UPI000839428C|nr:hypothetical protein [Paenibacillus sp. FJAT-26967]
MSVYMGNLLLLIIKILGLSSFVIMTFTIFKIPLRENHKSIAAMGMILGTVGYYIKNILNSPLYFIFLIAGFTVLLMVIRRYPILYCLLISLIGFGASTIVDTIISFTNMGLNLATIEQMKYDFNTNIALNIAYTGCCLLIATILHTFKLGFSFIVRRFSGTRTILKPHNFVWAMLLIAGALLTHIFIVSNNEEYHTYLLVGILIVFAASILYSFLQNKKVLKDRYPKTGGIDS